MSFNNSLQDFDTPGEALAHFGVKGMRWGIRKDRSASSAPNSSKAATVKKVAGGIGAVAMIGGAAFVAHKLSQGGSLPISSLKASSQSAQQAALVKSFLSGVDGGSEAEKYALQFLKAASG